MAGPANRVGEAHRGPIRPIPLRAYGDPCAILLQALCDPCAILCDPVRSWGHAQLTAQRNEHDASGVIEDLLEPIDHRGIVGSLGLAA